MSSLFRRALSVACAVTLATSMVPTQVFAETPTGGGALNGAPDLITIEAKAENSWSENASGIEEIRYDVEDCLDKYDVRDAVLGDDPLDSYIVPFASDGDDVSAKVRTAYDLICGGIRSHEEKIDLASCSITVGELKDAMDLVLCNPELWWLGSSYKYGRYLTSENADECQAASVSPMYAYTVAEVSEMAPEIEATIEEALSWLGPAMNEFEKAQVLHDYLVRTCQYSVEVAEGEPSQISYHRAVSALSGEKVTVCQGYALAYKWLLKRAGIDAVYVASEEMNHGWNLIKVDGSWHHVDVTWDDPLFRNPSTNEIYDGGFNANVSHAYFSKSDVSFQTMDDPHTGWETSLQALNDYPLAEGFVYPEYKGAYQYDCSVDGHKEPVIYRENEKAATCTDRGSYEAVPRCPACKEVAGDKKVVETPALGHKDGQYIFNNDATCTKNGTETATCAVCGRKDTREKAGTMIDHVTGKTEEAVVANPTCISPGKKVVKSWCSICSAELPQMEKPISALGHSYDACVVVKAATCTTAGTEQQVCSVCGEVNTRAIAATGHTMGSWTTVRVATCTVPGAEQRRCTHAGCAYSETRAAAATGHAFGAYRPNGDAKVGVNGTETATCSKCGSKTTRTAAGSALAPAVGQTVVVGSASYKATGAATVTYAGPSNKKAASVTVPATVAISGRTYKVTAIASKAFAGNKYLKSVKIGANVAAIPASAFKGCTKLTSVSFGSGITSLGKNAFYGCKALKSVTLGAKVATIGDGAFQNCTKLTKVTVKSKSLKSVGKSAFAGCKKLKTVTLKTTKLKSVGKNTLKGTAKKLTVKVPKAKVKAYQKLFKSKGSKTVAVKK